MASADSVPEPANNDEYSMRDLPAEINLEICSYLDVHDQEAMRKVCKSWGSNLSHVLLCKSVAVDLSKLPEQSENQEKNQPVFCEHNEHPGTVSTSYLGHALNIHVQKKTKVLIIRHVDFNGKKFDIVARVLKKKDTELIQLIFKDCAMQEAFRYRWAPENPLRIVVSMRLLPHPDTSATISFSTRKLILDNYTVRNILSGVFMSDFDLATFGMPCRYPIEERLAAGNMYKELPIVLPRFEFDYSQSPYQLYRSFIMAVEAQCPEVNPVVREDVTRLCTFWSTCQADLLQWVILGLLIKCLSADLSPLSEHEYVIDIEALRQVDPLTLNKLTTEVLHRLYCLPPDGVVYPRPVDTQQEDSDDLDDVHNE